MRWLMSCNKWGKCQFPRLHGRACVTRRLRDNQNWHEYESCPKSTTLFMTSNCASIEVMGVSGSKALHKDTEDYQNDILSRG